MTIQVIPIRGLPEVAPGDDLARLIAAGLDGAGITLVESDAVVVTQKVVSKAEGRVVSVGPDGKGEWVAAETRRVVGTRGDVLIVETRHGFICANAGVDASNVAAGFLTLLPEDPDGSAERIRAGLHSATGVRVGVIVTDTFGRAWRTGLVNVAIGCAGFPSLIDYRGTPDAMGRTLEVSVEALADEVAAASGTVMGKAEGVPVALVRGLSAEGPPQPASALIRPASDDLFRESPLQAIHARRSVRRFLAREVPPEALTQAVGAACTAPAPHHTRPWLFVVLRSVPARTRLLAAMAQAWTADLRGDGMPEHVIHRRLATSDSLLGSAPVLVIPCVRLRGAHSYPDDERAAAEREMFLLSGGAAIQNLMLALHAQGLASCWVSSTLFCKDETREALALDQRWIPLGSVAAGWPPDEAPPPRPPLDPADFLQEPHGASQAGRREARAPT